MAADLTSLRQKIEEHGIALCNEALLGIYSELDFNVPDSDKNPTPRSSPRVGPKLRETRFVLGPVVQGRVVRTIVGYTAIHAVYTNEGPDPHVIRAPGTGPFALGANLLHFWSRQEGDFVFRKQVFWKPGAGVAANIGWFNRSLAGWSDLLDQATNRVRS